MDFSEYYEDSYYKQNNYIKQHDYLVSVFTAILQMIESYGYSGKLFDVGCALGFMMEAAEKRGWSAFGIEISKTACRLAKKYTQGTVLNQRIDMGTEFPNGFFDAVTAYDVIEHVSNPRATIKEIKRVLRKDGLLYIHTLNYDGIGRRLGGINWNLLTPPGHTVYWTPKSLKRILGEEGFKIVNLSTARMATVNKFHNYFFNGLLLRRFTLISRLIPGDYLELFARAV